MKQVNHCFAAFTSTSVSLGFPSWGSTGSKWSSPGSISLAVIALVSIASLLLSVPAAFAADEICASCGQQVSVSGDFAHRKDSPAVTIEGVGANAAAFREEINGKNFTVSIAHLPVGKYTMVIGEVETLAGAASDDIRLKLPMTITAR